MAEENFDKPLIFCHLIACHSSPILHMNMTMYVYECFYCIIVYMVFTVNGVSTVAGHVAEKLGPHVKKHGAKLIPESMKTSKDGHASNLDGAKFVAASSVQGM